MLSVLGVGVQRLIRTRIGPLQLGSLARGAARALEDDEVRILTPTSTPTLIPHHSSEPIEVRALRRAVARPEDAAQSQAMLDRTCRSRGPDG